MSSNDIPNEESPVSIANKMFNLDGYTRETVSNILKSAGDINEEISLSYLRLLDFVKYDLVEAYRKLARYIIITGDSQNVNLIHERFCKIFSEQNAESYTEDQCHTLVTAFIILNSDLHSRKIPNKMTCDQFIGNIQKGYKQFSFESSSLKAIYKSIKQKEIKQKLEVIQIRKRSIENETVKNTEVKKTKNDVNKLPSSEVTSQDNNLAQQENKLAEQEDMQHFGFQILKVKISATGAFQIFENKSWKSYFGSISNLKLVLYKYDDFKLFYEDKIKLELFVVINDIECLFLLSRESPSQIDLNGIGCLFIKSHQFVHQLSLHHAIATQLVGDNRKCELTLIDNTKYILKVPEGFNSEKLAHCLNQASSLLSKLPLWTVQSNNSTRTIIQQKWSSEISKLSFKDQFEQTRLQMVKFEEDFSYLTDNFSRRSDYKAKLKYVETNLNRYRMYHRTLRMLSERANGTIPNSTNENTNLDYLTASNSITSNSIEVSTSSIHINSSSRMPLSTISEINSFVEDETET